MKLDKNNTALCGLSSYRGYMWSERLNAVEKGQIVLQKCNKTSSLKKDSSNG